MGCTSSSAVAGGYSVGDRIFYGGAGKLGRGNSQPLTFGAEGEVVGQTCRGDIIVFFDSGAGRITVRPPELSRKAPSIPGGYTLGESVFYGGPARKYPNGDQLWFSAEGRIAGRSCVGDGMDGERLAVMFPQHRDAKAVRLALLSREPPIIPGGYSVGDRVYWCGMNWTFPNGDRLKFGAEGEVAGRSCVGDGMDDERVAVNFPGNRGAVAMRLPEISHEPPLIPGGFNIGDRVFYAYPNWRAPDGHVLLFGVQGKVIGRSCIGDGKDDERVWVLFPGLGYGCICLEQISRDPPIIPGGYNLGDRVHYCGPSRAAGANGDRLTFGALGEVAGRATSSRGAHKAEIAVNFPGNEDAADVRLAEISRDAPIIPGGYNLGDYVFYAGVDWTYANGDRLTFGARGEVVGRACQGDGKDDERVAVLLPGNRVAAHLRLAEVARTPPPQLAMRLTERLTLAERPGPRTNLVVESASPRSPPAEQEEEVPASLPVPPVVPLAPAQRHRPVVVMPAGEVSSPHGTGMPGYPTRSGVARTGYGDEESPDIMELAVVYQTAMGAGIVNIAEQAQQLCSAQVKLAQRRGDMALLSELRRAAEDTEWEELRAIAAGALEEVALPKVLETAEAAGDLFAQMAVADSAKRKGLTELVERAEVLIRQSGLAPEELAELNADRKQLRVSKETERMLVDQMQLLLDDTYNGWGGYGKRTRTRDRPNEKVAERLEVESVVQLRNMESYLNYCVRRQVIASELPPDLRLNWNVRTDNSSPPSSPVSRGGSGDGYYRLLGPVDPDLNEHYLWHGTGPTEAEGIADYGFDIEQAGSSRGALFGRGLYFAESCLKADEYVRPRKDGRFPLILCRVILGHVNYCDAEDPWELRETLRGSCRPGAGGHHSVLGDREKVRQTFREFVIFDGHQAYPEYIIWYSRK